MTKKFLNNKELLKESRRNLRKAKLDYAVVRDLSLDSDLLKSLTGVHGDVEGEYDELYKTGNVVIDLKHIIKMAKFKMKREARKMLKTQNA